MKYKPKDYLRSDKAHSVFIRVEAAVNGEIPFYALRNAHVDKKLWWVSEYVLDAFGFFKDTPKFEAWNNLKAGDLIAHGEKNGHKDFVKVLARIDNLVMLSMSPVHPEEEPANKIVAQLNELADEAGIDDETREVTTKMVSSVIKATTQTHLGIEEIDEEIEGMMHSLTKSHKVCRGEWIPLERLALEAHWEIMSE